VPSLFSRKSSTATAEESAPAVTEDTVVPRGKGYTPGKGRATSKRTAAGRRSSDAPPASRREAYKRQRSRNREDRMYAMEQQRAGNDAYLTKRDKGPERALVRDLVDRRRTLGPWLLLIMLLVVFIFSNTAWPVAVQIFGQVLLTMTLVGTVVDSFFIGRGVHKQVGARFPETTQRMRGLIFYGIMRGLQARRLRIPRPRKQIGDALDSA